ncbi:carboxy terminal-processing peptidase [Zhouia sp. PK063]|uniref:carboxy terminal-processing peptidase n=1 Tax=Zhouia sp. PK063 TaxID=3373602 RepID=UPI0037B954A8
MKRKFAYLLGAILISVASCSFITNKKFDNPDKDKLLIDLISYVLEKGHYSPKDFDDKFSEQVYKDYLNALDPLKRYFLASDIKEFDAYKDAIDDQIKTSDISFFNLTYTRLMQRMKESEGIYKEVLNTPFDFDKKEEINVDYDSLPYAKNEKELKDRWRKQLKFSALSRYADQSDEREKLIKSEGASVDKGVAFSDDDKKIIASSPKDFEKKARESLLSQMNDTYDVLDDMERKDWFDIYLNTIVTEFDPHTYYFAPEEKERFDTSMSGSFEGIGAQLQKKNDKIKISQVISGGPVWRGKLLDVGDEIMKVAQEGKEPVSVAGMRLDDAVKMIKGPKGTKVILTVKRVDGNIEDVSITRDVVELEETYAKSSLVKKDGKTFGIINLPKFYVDFTDYDKRNAASDVAKEIEKLKKSGMQGLVLDLRDNGGGSLKTVVDLAGLFIKNGPVVQVKSTGAHKEVLEDKDDRIQWDGPLVILVNELSASASEIMAAAMQDYKRAVIIGSKQTYGKGTVQNVIDLNQFLQSNSYGDVGALKITTQKFYRISGGSTQLKGVNSDVVIPDKYSYIDVGERDQENPLPWDKIDAANYNVWSGYTDYSEAIANSNARLAKNKDISLIDENAKWIRTQQDEKMFPLNYKSYKAEIAKDEETIKKFKALRDYKNNLSFTSLPYEDSLIAKDTVLAMKRKRWHEDLSKDLYVEEALNVLEDLKVSNFSKQNVAVKD